MGVQKLKNSQVYLKQKQVQQVPVLLAYVAWGETVFNLLAYVLYEAYYMYISFLETDAIIFQCQKRTEKRACFRHNLSGFSAC